MNEQVTAPPTAPAPLLAELPKGLAIASMVLGIVSLVLFCAWPISGPCAIVGLILGIIAGGRAKRGEAGGRGMATAGVITSAIAIVAAVLFTVLSIANFMRHSQYQQAWPVEEEVSVQQDTQTQQKVSVQEEPQEIEPGQQDAPSTAPED